MPDFTYDEFQLMAMYDPGTRSGLIDELCDVQLMLEPDEEELLSLTESTIRKLCQMSDEQFLALEPTLFMDAEDVEA